MLDHECPMSCHYHPPPGGTTGTKDPMFFHGVLQSPVEISRCVVRVPLKPLTGLVGLPLLKTVSFLCRRTRIWGTLTNPIGQSSNLAQGCQLGACRGSPKEA